MPTALLDIVAVAYQAPAETARFLDSLQYVDVPFTLTLIDNASPDPLVKRAIRHGLATATDLAQCVDARAVFNSDNVGYARAVNQGMRLNRSQFAAILNCDTEFIDGQSVEKILAHFLSQEAVGVLGPRTTDSANRITHAGIVNDPLTGRDLHRGWQQSDVGSFTDRLSVPTVSGATYFVRRSMWDEMTACPLFQAVAPQARGAFLPTEMYYEETYLSYHCRAHNWDVVYFGDVKMIHQWNRSSTPGVTTGLNMGFQKAENYFREACDHHGIKLTW